MLVVHSLTLTLHAACYVGAHRYHIKQHYYRSHTKLNFYGIVPIGDPAWTDWSKPHGREALSASA